MSRFGETHIPRLVAESRRAQQLPEHVEDPAALARVVALLRAAGRQAAEGGRQSAAHQDARGRGRSGPQQLTRPRNRPPTPSDG